MTSGVDDVEIDCAGLLERRIRLPDHVVYRAFGGETVVLNLEAGTYHGLNPTAGRMLEALEGASRVREAAAALAELYGHPQEAIETDLCTFCRDLLRRGLIEAGDPAD